MAAFGRMQQATALVPLAVLSAAWTVSMAGAGIGTAAAGDETAGLLPDGTVVPTEAIEAPASVSTPGFVAPGVPRGQAARVVGSASTSGIPAAALAAYQRAESVINAADRTCDLPWQLIAAIGRVESDHGRFGGNVLDDDGVARPGIYGIALDGKNNTQRIPDTDAGQHDSDDEYDRAVGPMQFIPSTWSVVGVDGDSDGKRNPQDIDDAALATAVYLCSGDDDLSGEQGQRASVYRYNHSNAYVDLVLSIMQAYLDGDFLSVPTRTTSAGVFAPDPDRPTGPARGTGQTQGAGAGAGTAPVVQSGNGTRKPTTTPTAQPTRTSTPTPVPVQQPTQDPTRDATKDATEDPVTVPVEVPTTQPPLPSISVPPPEQTVTFAEAQAQCLASGISVLDPTRLDACTKNLMTP